MSYKLESRWLGETPATISLSYANDTTLMAESKEELKNLMRVKEQSEKAYIKLSIKTNKQRSWHLAQLLHVKE